MNLKGLNNAWINPSGEYVTDWENFDGRLSG